MHVLKNQTVYQCEYCGKRLLTKAGARIHENKYCWHPESPNKVTQKKKQDCCQHNNKVTMYRTIPGEAVQEPDYEVCVDCGAIV